MFNKFSAGTWASFWSGKLEQFVIKILENIIMPNFKIPLRQEKYHLVFFNLSPRINCFLFGEKDLWKELFRELNPAQVLFRLTWLRMKEFFLSRRLFKPGKIQRLPGGSQQATSSLRVTVSSPSPRVKRRRGNVYANLTLIVFRDVTLL